MGHCVFEPLEERAPSRIEHIIGRHPSKLVGLVDDYIGDGDEIDLCQFIKGVSQDRKLILSGDEFAADRFNSAVDELGGMDFRPKGKSIDATHSLAERNELIEKFTPSAFVDNDATKAEVCGRGPDQTCIASFVNIHEIQGGLP